MDKKKRRKKVTSWVALALVVALLTAMPLMAKAEVENDGPVATVYSGTVEKGGISTVLRGGGNLTTKDAQDVKIPSGVKITEFLVSNGDVVAKGDPVAKVDKVSVMTAIVEVKETMEKLQDQIEDARNEKVSSSIKATAGGRIKQIFAREGDSVQEVMLEHGALAVLSLDSLMAVEFPTGAAIATGDSVSVTLSDGTEVTGRVESNLNGVVVITVEDEGYAIGENVTVETEDGTPVGEGQLYIHNAWKATAFAGTVSRVSAQAEKEVRAGAVLFTLKDTEFAAQLEHLANQHREYEKLMQQLFQMYESETICAPCGGQVSGVEKDSPFLLSGGNVEWEAIPLENVSQEKGWTVMLLSEVKPEQPAPDGEGGKQPEEETKPESGSYMGFAGKVTHIGREEIIATMSQLGAEVTQTEDGGWDLSQVDLDPQNMIHSGMTFAVADADSYEAGDIIVVIYDEAGEYSVAIAQKVNPEPEEDKPTQPTIPGGGQFPGGMGGMGGFGGFDISGLLGGMMGGFPTMGGLGGGAQEEEEELFDLEGEVLLTVTPQDTVSLTITLDEHDIAKVFVGQSAQVKVEALRDQVFEAEVTKVSVSGSNSGGSSKFTAQLELSKAADMLDGMSATASLPLYTRMDVLSIPVKALNQQGARTVVYTALDSETGEPTNPVEVTTGISDGETVEILSGLQMGDSFYYSYYDTLELDTNAEVSRFTFG